MASRFFIAGIALLLFACVGVLLMLRRPGPQDAPPPSTPAAASTSPSLAAPEGAESMVGVIIADGSVDISSKFEGHLESIDVEVGDQVRKGQVLARLDVAPLQREAAVTEADLQAARSEEEVARVALAEAQDALTRVADPKLVSLGATSQEEQARLRYAEQSAAARLATAKARVQTQQARLEMLQLRMSETTLRAPFDGRISQRYLDAGALVPAGRPILHLLRGGAQKVRFAIPEAHAPRLPVGTRVSIQVPAGGPVLTGKVENVAPEVDTAARMVLAIASLDMGTGPQLPFGTAVRVAPAASGTAASQGP